MSLALYEKGGLRFWEEREIVLRDHAAQRLLLAVSLPLTSLNSAWTFRRIEASGITPIEHISEAYDESDIWSFGDGYAMRAETTASSYLYAEYLLKSGKAKLPLCVWQHGKSFRRETNDGARASELRFNEFYQCEFQCIYRTDSKADYQTPVIESVMDEIAKITGKLVRLVPSDRLPAYSLSTMDIECNWNGKWKEAASISQRTDFPGHSVLEVAVGTDRLISMEGI
jgi:glycyl-tRNA synthetase